jgi:transposase
MATSGIRTRRSVAEKRRVVELTLEPGASVARVAQSEGVNANQVFAWRRLYRAGKLTEDEAPLTALLPVVVSPKGAIEEQRGEEEQPAADCGSIHIELPGRALISVERGADRSLLRAALEVLSK